MSGGKCPYSGTSSELWGVHVRSFKRPLANNKPRTMILNEWSGHDGEHPIRFSFEMISKSKGPSVQCCLCQFFMMFWCWVWTSAFQHFTGLILGLTWPKGLCIWDFHALEVFTDLIGPSTQLSVPETLHFHALFLHRSSTISLASAQWQDLDWDQPKTGYCER